MIWNEASGAEYKAYRNIATDGLSRKFQVLRDRTYDPDVVWIGEFYSPDGTNKYLIYTASNNMAHSKDGMSVFGEAVYTDDRLRGSSGDHANYSAFEYRDSNKVWHDTTLVCYNNLHGYSHYHLSCSESVWSFATWDDRN